MESDRPDRVRVLHVDDDPAFADLTAERLERADERFVVETAASAAAGADLLAAERFDCVVSDYDMPGVDGIGFLETVRERDPDLPFVLFTGKGSEEIASEAISAGVTDYLQKGSGAERYTLLANRVANAVEASRSRRALTERTRRLETLVDTIPGIVYRRTAADRSMAAAEGDVEALTGHPAARLEGVVSWDADVVHPDDREAVRAALDEAVETGEPFEVTYRIRTAGGETRWMRERGRGVPADDPTTLEGLITDVTERVAHERDLQTERTRLRAITDALPDVGVVYDAEGRYREVLTEREDLLVDLASSLRGTTVDDALPPTAAETVRAAIDRALATGEVQAVEYALDLDRGRTWFEGRLAPFAAAGEDLVILLARDVTDAHERRARLEQYRQIVDEMEQAACLYDADGRFVAVNDYLAEWYDTTPAALEGERSALVERVRASADPDPFAALVAGDRTSLHGEAEGSFGDHGHAVVSYQLTRLCVDGEFRGVVCVARDVTDRRRREQAIVELHRATRALFRADSEEEVAARVAEAVRDILGYPINVVRLADGGRLRPVAITEDAELALGDRPVYDVGETPAGRALAEGETLVFEDVSTLDDGHDRGEARAGLYLPIGDHGTVSVSDTDPGTFDETDVRLAEVLAANAGAALDRLDRTRALERQNARLAEFTSVVSHDLRNPLGVAVGRLDLAREDCDSPHLDGVARALDRIQTLVDDLLVYARQGDEAGDPEPVALAALARECWETVETAAATLDVRTDRVVEGHPSRLRQFFENLFRNAVEHGGERVAITVGDLPGGDGFYVADDGPGVPAAVRERAFEFGFSTAEDGSGIGLSIVAQVAEAHGWTVELAPDAEGTRVEVRGLG
jgi:PAS domain S-box-containing protein